MPTQTPTLEVSAELISKSCSSLKKYLDVQNTFEKVAPAELANSKTLVFANTENLLQLALAHNALGIIVTDKLAEVFKEKFSPKQSVWTTNNVHFAMTEVLPFFDTKKPMNTGVHSTASIDPSASIGANVTIEPHAVIGPLVRIGDNSVIGAHCTLANSSTVGKNTQLSSHVFVGSNCHIGDFCIIGPQTVLGADGFGFYTDKQGRHHKIPQLGTVVIEDNCELGALCAVDRATLTETRVKKGSKLDNFIHLAHNTEIGEHSLIAAGFIVAGSTKIGNHFTAAGGVHVNGHVKITDRVLLTGRAGVISSIDEAGVYGGFPAINHKDNLKVLASLTALPKLKKQVSHILKHLGLDKDQ